MSLSIPSPPTHPIPPPSSRQVAVVAYILSPLLETHARNTAIPVELPHFVKADVTAEQCAVMEMGEVGGDGHRVTGRIGFKGWWGGL